MSTTDSTPTRPYRATDAETETATDPADDATDPHDFFSTLIRADRTICDTCFRRTRDVNPAPPRRYFDALMDRRNRHSSETLKACVTDRATLGHGGEHCYPPPKPHEDDPYRTRPSYGTIVCEACGHIDNPGDVGFGAGLTETRDDATLTLSTLKRALDRCLDRAREAGYSVDEQAAFAAADHLKTTPEHAHRDADIVAAALTLGVRNGRHVPADAAETETDAEP